MTTGRALERPQWTRKHLEVGKEYRINTTNGGRVTGTLVELDDDVLLVRPNPVNYAKAVRQDADLIVVIAQIANVVPTAHTIKDR